MTHSVPLMEMERNKAAASHSWARQHAWRLLSFFPFPLGRPPHPPCRGFSSQGRARLRAFSRRCTNKKTQLDSKTLHKLGSKSAVVFLSTSPQQLGRSRTEPSRRFFAQPCTLCHIVRYSAYWILWLSRSDKIAKIGCCDMSQKNYLPVTIIGLWLFFGHVPR